MVLYLRNEYSSFLFKQKEFDTFIWVIQVLLIYPILSIQSMKWTWIPFYMYKCSNWKYMTLTFMIHFLIRTSLLLYVYMYLLTCHFWYIWKDNLFPALSALHWGSPSSLRSNIKKISLSITVCCRMTIHI